MNNEIGMELGQALTNIGKQIGENSEWDRRRKIEEEAAIRDLQNRMKLSQQSAVQEARLKPPTERSRRIKDESGTPVDVFDRWEINPEGTGGSWVEDRRMPVMLKEFPKTREIKRGSEFVTEELQPDGTVREVGRAPRFSDRIRSGRGSKPKQDYATAVHPDDPNRRVKIIMSDGKSDYVRGPDGDFVDVTPVDNKKKDEGFLSSVASSLDRGITNLSKAARAASERGGAQPEQANAEDEQTLRNALSAIRDGGADPNAVRRYLIENGKSYLADKI